MNSRERVIAAINHKPTDRFPRMTGILPYVSIYRAEEMKRFFERFPADVGGFDPHYGKSDYERGVPFRMGGYTDEFGCRFELGEDGVVGEVKQYIFEDWSAFDSYRMPYEVIKGIDTSAPRTDDRFLTCGTHIRPFERMQFMRGTENLLMDLGMGEPYVEKLLKELHKFNVAELEQILKGDFDAFTFMDDWGSQTSMLISPTLWRQLFKPLYAEYVKMAHQAGKYAYFHSDGCIEAIYPDLADIGIDIVNSQMFCMDIERVVETNGDRICFCGEIDRQHLLGFGTPEQIRAAVDRLADAVIKKNGCRSGMIAQCEWGSHDPYENICAVFERFNEK